MKLRSIYGVVMRLYGIFMAIFPLSVDASCVQNLVSNVHKDLKLLQQEYARIKVCTDLTPNQRQKLMCDNRLQYDKLCMVQQKQLLKNIKNKLIKQLQDLVVSFIMGGVNTGLEEGFFIRKMSNLSAYLVAKRIDSLCKPWKVCDFAHTSKEVVYIARGSGLMFRVDVEKDVITGSIIVPFEMRDAIGIEAFIPGMIILRTADLFWIQKKDQAVLLSDAIPNELVAALPPNMINVEYDKQGCIYAWYRSKDQDKQVGLCIAGVGAMQQCIAVPNSERNKCLLIYQNRAKVFDIHEPSVTSIIEWHHEKFGIPFVPCNGCMPATGKNIVVWSENLCHLHVDNDKTSAYYIEGYIKGGIGDVRIHKKGDFIVILPKKGSPPMLLYANRAQCGGFAKIHFPSWLGGSDHVRLKDERLLFNGANGDAWMVDVPDIIKVTNSFTVEQANLCDSLWQAYCCKELLSAYIYRTRKKLLHEQGSLPATKSLLEKVPPLKIMLNEEQLAVWRSIPITLRNCFSRNLKKELDILDKQGKAA